MMDKQYWTSRVISQLEFLADKPAQESVWVRQDRPGVVSSPSEEFSVLLDDLDFEHFIELSAEWGLSEQVRDALQKVVRLFVACEVSNTPAVELLERPQWAEFVRCVRDAVKLLTHETTDW